MSTNAPIPVAVAPRLREGAKSLMRTLGCDLEDAAEDPPAFGELQERLRGVWGLLDVIGWSDEDDHGEVAVDLDEHSAALLAALDEILPTSPAERPSAGWWRSSRTRRAWSRADDARGHSRPARRGCARPGGAPRPRGLPGDAQVCDPRTPPYTPALGALPSGWCCAQGTGGERARRTATPAGHGYVGAHEQRRATAEQSASRW